MAAKEEEEEEKEEALRFDSSWHGVCSGIERVADFAEAAVVDQVLEGKQVAHLPHPLRLKTPA